ncbi:hypothetical protein [Anabaena catenula]|uniref:Uncharacterized protein n=1 Tax=Anabaena catenula FACHB-362 TaxID=2692877 RepID=A0ABR8J2Q4_9NOST|nr:hypothetical protein [Anabaena catenula]MBD2692642.1 hypothetical protein [Anabaena catenula FACHB-362]
MNTLFNLADYNTVTPVRDPYWDEIVLDSSGRVEESGQTTLFYDSTEEPPEPDDFQNLQDFELAWQDWEKLHPDFKSDMSVLEEEESLPEQEKTDYPELLHSLPEQPKQWLEEYYVSRNGKKHWYFRYCFYSLGIHHIHIPGGNIENAIAIGRKEMIERAIALGKSPYEIQNFIKGGFGLNGYRLL